MGLPVCAVWPRHCAGCVGACPAVRGAGEMDGRADAAAGHHRGGGGPVHHRPRVHPLRVAVGRPAAGLLGAASVEHRRAGGLGAAAGPWSQPEPAGPTRLGDARCASDRAGAAGRVRRGQLGAAYRGAATAQPGPGRGPGGAERPAARGPGHRRSARSGRGIALDASGACPAVRRGEARRDGRADRCCWLSPGRRWIQYTTGRGFIPFAWLSVGPLLASLCCLRGAPPGWRAARCCCALVSTSSAPSPPARRGAGADPRSR